MAFDTIAATVLSALGVLAEPPRAAAAQHFVARIYDSLGDRAHDLRRLRGVELAREDERRPSNSASRPVEPVECAPSRRPLGGASSAMGSLGLTSGPERLESTIASLIYSPLKAAINMLTTEYAKAFPWLRVYAVDPCHTATDFNGRRGTKPVEQGAAR